MAILDNSEFTEVEGRYYANPQVALDESNQFIDNLRATQQGNNQQIAEQTYNLGTAVPTNLGGLTSPTGDAGLSYFTSRYTVPQTSSAVANLRATAQAQALNEVLANEQAMWKKRYQDAYRNYQRRASRGGGGGSSGGNNNDNTSTWGGEVDTEESPTREFYGVPGADVSETDRRSGAGTCLHRVLDHGQSEWYQHLFLRVKK